MKKEEIKEKLAAWWGAARKFWVGRGARWVSWGFGPFMLLVVVISVLISPLPQQWAENNLYAVALMLGLSAGIACGAFYLRGAFRRGRLVAVPALLAAAPLSALAGRYLLLSPGVLYSGGYLFLVAFALVVTLAAFCFYSLFRWSKENSPYFPVLALALLVTAVAAGTFSLAGAAAFRQEAVRYFKAGHLVEQRFVRQVSSRASLAVGAGGLFVVEPGAVYSLDGESGEELWSRETQEIFSSTAGSLNAVLVESGLLVYPRGRIKVEGERALVASLLDPDTGEVIRNVRAPAAEKLASEAVYLTEQFYGGGSFYYLVQEAEEPFTVMLRAVNLRGAVRWERFFIESPASVQWADGLILVRENKEWLALDGATGMVEWTCPAAALINDYTRADSYFILAGGDLEILVEGELQWSWSPPGGASAGTVTAVGETVYAGLSGGEAAALDMATGEPVWIEKLEQGRGVVSLVTPDADGSLWVATPRGGLYNVDSGSGEPRWCYRGRDFAAIRAMARADEMIYYISGNYLYGLYWEEVNGE